MKQNKRIETIIYGVLGLIFTAAFFFGIMYPEYGITRQCDFCETYGDELPASGRYETFWDGAGTCDVTGLEDIRCTANLGQRRRKARGKNIVYASYFYDCLRSGS